MAKSKPARVAVTIECVQCRVNSDKRTSGVSRYLVSKNKKNTVEKLELKKYCKYCNIHTLHKEIK